MPADETSQIIAEKRLANTFFSSMALLIKMRNCILICFENDALNDPLMNEYHIRALKLATRKDMEEIKKLSFKINDLLKEFFSKRKLDLVDFKLEFGKYKNKIFLGDEISPDTCRLWEEKTKKKLDKDRFRRDLGEIEQAYEEVLKRVRLVEL